MVRRPRARLAERHWSASGGGIVRTPNGALRRARERTGLTRAELADRVARHVYEQSAQVAAIDAHYVAKLERGVIRRPGHAYRDALRAVLGAEIDAELGLAQPSPTSAGPAPPVSSGASVQALAESFRAADRTLGGTHLYSSVHRFLTETVVPAAADEPSFGLTAVAVVTDMCGWMAFDAGDSAVARTHFDAAYRLGRATHDPTVAAYACASMAHLADDMGLADDAARIADVGLSQDAGSASASLSARLAAMAARAHAQRGDVRRCRELLALAEAMTPDGPGNEPWWLPVFDLGALQMETATCWQRLARLDDAERCARDVFRLRTPERIRSRALAGLTLAEIALARVDLDGAAEHATPVARIARGLASRRVLSRLDAVTCALAPYRRRSSVAALLDLGMADPAAEVRSRWPV